MYDTTELPDDCVDHGAYMLLEGRVAIRGATLDRLQKHAVVEGKRADKTQAGNAALLKRFSCDHGTPFDRDCAECAAEGRAPAPLVVQAIERTEQELRTENERLKAVAADALVALYKCAPEWWDTQEEIEKALAAATGESAVEINERLMKRFKVGQLGPTDRERTRVVLGRVKAENTRLRKAAEEARATIVQTLGGQHSATSPRLGQRPWLSMQQAADVLRAALEGEKETSDGKEAGR